MHAFDAAPLSLGGHVWQVSRPTPFALIIHGHADAHPGEEPHDYLHEVLLAPPVRERFFDLVDATGLVVCKNLDTHHPSYRNVRGRSSRGRLSQGEFYHHDGCSGPTKPRVVEIRCPYQDFARSVATAVAPFAAIVPAMIRALPAELAPAPAVASICARLLAGEPLDDATLDHVQGQINRLVRRELAAEQQRAYFRAVDAMVGAHVAPWEKGESRLIANANAGVTMQHRRAYQQVHSGGVPTGRLVKRWPAEELLEIGDALDPAIADLRACEDAAG
jgi:hypothetical protein